MGNRRAREFQLQQDRLARDAEEERASALPRPAGFTNHTGGVGCLRLQLIVRPSFEEARAWEIRQGRHAWALCNPRVTEPGPMLVGYDRVEFESDRLQEYFQRVTGVNMDLGPDLDGFGGADGSLYQLGVFGDLYSEFRFQWWSVPPPQWRPLVGLANEMIQAFLMAEGRSAQECADWLE